MSRQPWHQREWPPFRRGDGGGTAQGSAGADGDPLSSFTSKMMIASTIADNAFRVSGSRGVREDPRWWDV